MRAWLRSVLLGPDASLAAPIEAPDEAPYRSDPCPDCGCDDFTPGGPTVGHESNGTHARLPQRSGVLCCLACGGRWYGTKDGLRRPHEAALPPQWAIIDAQAKARAEQAAAQRAAQATRTQDAAQRPAASGPASGFRRPPKPR